VNDQQAAFASAFVVNGGNAAQAAISAGYSPKRARLSGHELVNRPDVGAFIDQLSRDRGQASEVEPVWLEEQFVHYAEAARRGEYPPSIGLRAWRLWLGSRARWCHAMRSIAGLWLCLSM
jgi:phage terminase small subunit